MNLSCQFTIQDLTFSLLACLTEIYKKTAIMAKIITRQG